MGHGGETGPDNDIVKRIIERTGADVMGRRMFGEGLDAATTHLAYRVKG
jgi:hypothetical protein